MSYTDTSFTVQNGYTYVHNKQFYDAIAAQLGTHAAWSFVESVDYVNGTVTQTTYVWKNLSTVSGLIKDYYVGFTTYATSGVYSTQVGVRVTLFEDYNSTTHVAGRFANRGNSTAMTLQSDGSCPYTWTLNTALPAGDPNGIHAMTFGPNSTNGGSTQGYTTYRMLAVVSNTTIALMINGINASVQGTLYVGAFDSVLSSALDPLPLILGGSGSGPNGALPNVIINGSVYATTRHPSLGGQSITFANCHTNGAYAQDNNGGQQGWWESGGTLGGLQQAGIHPQLGGTGDSQAGLWIPVLVGRATLWTAPNSAPATPSTRGGFHGTLKHIGVAVSATHAFGDTFLVDGAPYAGWGAPSSNSLICLLDTTA